MEEPTLGHGLQIIRPVVDSQQLVHRVQIDIHRSRPRPAIAFKHHMAEILHLARARQAVRGGRHAAPMQGGPQIAAIQSQTGAH